MLHTLTLLLDSDLLAHASHSHWQRQQLEKHALYRGTRRTQSEEAQQRWLDESQVGIHSVVKIFKYVLTLSENYHQLSSLA